MFKRTLTTLAMAAIGLPAIILGGPFYYLVFTIFLVGAAWEFAHLYRAVKYEPHALFTA
jgi:CDP-diglyceride synthetase